MEVAEKAARKAKEMADEAYRASRGHRRHASRIERENGPLEADSKTVPRQLRDFLGMGQAAESETSQQSPANVGPVRTPADNPARSRCSRKGLGGWIKPVLIALVVLAFIPGPRAFGVHVAHGGASPWLCLAAIVYFAYRRV